MRTGSKFLAALALVCITLWNGPVTAEGTAWGAGYIPNVELVTQEGKKVRLYDDVIKGRIVVISFIYTSCRDICPLITARMAQVYDRLGSAAGRKFHFVSITVDPEVDTPARLKEHADAFRSDPNWRFLTGSRANIDLARHKLGERSRKLTEHRSDILLRNDVTGEWARDSAFADIERLALTIQALDPDWRPAAELTSATPALTPASSVEELPGQGLFAKACASCHTIGQGDRVGPDLAGIPSRRSRDWIASFIRNPEAARTRRDPVVLALMSRFPTIRMPNLQLSEHDAADLLSYLEARSFADTAGKREAAIGTPRTDQHVDHGQRDQHRHH